MRRQSGRPPALTEQQAAIVKVWASIGTRASQVARKLGVSEKSVRACIRGEHKLPYRSA